MKDKKDKKVGTGCASPEKCDKCEEYLTGWKRALADYDNLQKDLVRAKSDMQRHTVESFFEKLIPTIDHFDQALKNVPDQIPEEMVSWIAGIGHIQKSLIDIAREFSCEPIEPLGQPFDPNEHEAISTVSNKDKPDEIIMEVHERGWKLAGKVIRPAKVIVNKIN